SRTFGFASVIRGLSPNDWVIKNESFLAFTTHLPLAEQNLARYKLQIVESPDPNKDGPDFEPSIWIWSLIKYLPEFLDSYPHKPLVFYLVNTIHPRVTDSNYKREIPIMMSSQIWQFKKGNKIAQLLPLSYISINSSNDVQTDGFDNSDQKQSLWTSII
ncbi:hypothetical protein Celaphus_00009259, partial [Cervus elaphus hippelaphus]